MRPLTLRMAGLRSYRVERTVDFTELSLVAIIGPTGAGKSSLLEAITYALYGASTWDRRAVKELISDAAASMRVSLEFEADGERWQVTRMISRKTAASHELICLSDPEHRKDRRRPERSTRGSRSSSVSTTTVSAPASYCRKGSSSSC